ncbi:MAG: PhzF family phenazine biosynthesis protein [Verrucomicrobiales bacterium]|jgi:PhzF family phenazine biosynthesis protein
MAFRCRAADCGQTGRSETAFISPSQDGTFKLRWFTPSVEVDLCGHATLAAAYVLWETKATSTSPIIFTTLSGDLPVKLDDLNGRITLNFPADSAIRDSTIDELRDPLAAALGIDPMVICDCFSGRMDSVIVVNDERQVFQCRPDFVAIQQLDTRGVLLTAQSKAGSVSDFTYRFFVPSCGIDEDPVTGSAHCLLGPYWSEQLEKTKLVAYQASDRGGLLYVELAPGSERILISGQAKFILEEADLVAQKMVSAALNSARKH